MNKLGGVDQDTPKPNTLKPEIPKPSTEKKANKKNSFLVEGRGGNSKTPKVIEAAPVNIERANISPKEVPIKMEVELKSSNKREKTKKVDKVKKVSSREERAFDKMDVDMQSVKPEKSRFWSLDPVILAMGGILLLVVCVGGNNVWKKYNHPISGREWALLPTSADSADSPTDQVLRFRSAAGGINTNNSGTQRLLSISRGRNLDESDDEEKEMRELRLLDSDDEQGE